MRNIKKKAEEFWEKHDATIIGIGTSVAVGTLVTVVAYKSYKAGFIDGGMIGFEETLRWLDETFPDESKAQELYEIYKKTHPENIVYRKGFGKWAH